MARWVIIGGAGLVGADLARKLLARGDSGDVVVVDLPEALGRVPEPVRRCAADVRDAAALKLRSGDLVVHLAARQYHGGVPARARLPWFREVNAYGTANVLQAAMAANVAGIVYFSTDMVYGIPRRLPVGSDHPRAPLGPYGASKAEAEVLCIGARKRGLPVTIFRPRLIMGPGRAGLMTKMFKTITANRPLPMIGHGDNHYQMVSVDDCTDAIMMAVEQGFPCRTLNLGTVPDLTVRELLQRLVRTVGSRSVLVPLPAAPAKAALGLLDAVGMTVLYPEQFRIADKDHVVDVAETRAAIGWRPKHRDLEVMIAAYRHWKHTTGG